MLKALMAALGALLLVASLSAQEITQDAIDAKVREIASFIAGHQRSDGSYLYRGTHYPVGASALAALALRTAGVSADDPSVARAIAYIAAHKSNNTYEEALVICALEKVDPEKHLDRIKLAAESLRSAQRKSGGWGYSEDAVSGNYVDESCSQYAILGLASADACKVEFPADAKAFAKRYFRNGQRTDGGWGYRGGGSTVSMTCAGLASLRLLGERIETPLPGRCGEYKVDKGMSAGIEFLGRAVPGFLASAHSSQWGYYAMYGMERTGILNGLKEIGGVNWYREGCANILAHNNWREDVSTASFALLFIARNAAPYAISKWKWGSDWNCDRFDAANWVEHVSKTLGTPLDWQFADIRKGLGEAGRSSMIYASGHGRFAPSEVELAALREFLDGGGVVVGEACCGDEVFIKSFTKVMETLLYPGRDLKFRKLPPTHPVLNCRHKISNEEAGILILGRNCGRKQVFLLTKDISCAWNGDQVEPYEIERARRVGTNLLTYSLGRRKPQAKFAELNAKPASLEDELSSRAKAGDGAAFNFRNPLGRIKHGGDWSSDPNLWKGIARAFESNPSLPAFDGEIHADPESDDIFSCQTLLITGHGEPLISAKGIANIRRYVQNGGGIAAEACCSDAAFDRGFKSLAAALFPNRKLEPIPKDDPVWLTPCRLTGKSPICTKAMGANPSWPKLLGVRDGKRWALIYSPCDISCALEGDLEEDIAGLKPDSAAEMWANILNALSAPAGGD